VAKLNLHREWGRDSIVRKQEDYTGNRVETAVKTLDSLGIRHVGLIKIDTEGYEIPILGGATETILSNKPPPSNRSPRANRNAARENNRDLEKLWL